MIMINIIIILSNYFLIHFNKPTSTSGLRLVPHDQVDSELRRLHRRRPPPQLLLVSRETSSQFQLPKLHNFSSENFTIFNSNDTFFYFICY